MLSRRHLRIKVLQSLYGYFIAEDENTGKYEKELLSGIDLFYDLFLSQILLLSEIRIAAERQIEDSKLKHLPTEQELNPNTRFIKNHLLRTLSENSVLNNHIEKRKISWSEENELIKKVFGNFKSGTEYEKYTTSEENNFEKDKGIVLTLIKKYIAEFPQLFEFYERKNIFWVNDMDSVNHILVKIIKSLKEDAIDETINDIKLCVDDDDRKFAVDLFRKTIMSSEKYGKIISEKTFNWDIERIAIIDTILMKMSICELLDFPTIPVKVTLNEYIELSKIFSTERSSMFINGILDKLICDFKNADLIKKTGRGLI